LARRIRQSFVDEHNAKMQEDIISDLINERDRHMDRAEELQMMLDNVQAAIRDALIEAGVGKYAK
jgi:hypothetical protein